MLGGGLVKRIFWDANIGAAMQHGLIDLQPTLGLQTSEAQPEPSWPTGSCTCQLMPLRQGSGTGPKGSMATRYWKI